jgi:hypothetical protein
MSKTIITLAVGVSLTLLAASHAHARGFGGYHGGGGGYHGGGYHGSYSGGGYHGAYSGGESRYGESRGGYGGESRYGESRGGYGGESRGGYSSGGQREGGYSGAEGAAAGHATTKRNEPQYSGAQGAAAGYAAGNRGNTSWAGASHVALPTDAGYGMSAARAGGTAYAGYHQTGAVNGNVYAARGAAVRNAYTGGAFGHGWYAGHPGVWNPAAWSVARAWGVATWPAIGAWYGWGATTQPIYYDYGNNVNYQDGQVYVDGQPVATADQYYQQAATLSQSQAAPDPNGYDWMPLGVFGLVKDDQADPNFILQLAVSKAGAVGGNYHDVISGTTLPVQGAVDKKTQRIAWTVGDNKTTVGETGIYNLTKDESPALIHIGKDKTQQWTLVRLKQPEQAGDGN